MLPRGGSNRVFYVLLKLVSMAKELILAPRVPLELRGTGMSKWVWLCNRSCNNLYSMCFLSSCSVDCKGHDV